MREEAQWCIRLTRRGEGGGKRGEGGGVGSGELNRMHKEKEAATI